MMSNSGSGRRCNDIIDAICELAGIRDLKAKVHGSHHPHNTVRGGVEALASMQSPGSVAARRGKEGVPGLILLILAVYSCYTRKVRFKHLFHDDVLCIEVDYSELFFLIFLTNESNLSTRTLCFMYQHAARRERRLIIFATI